MKFGEKTPENGQENEILVQVWDQAQIIPWKPQTSSDKSRLFHDYEAIKPRLWSVSIPILSEMYQLGLRQPPGTNNLFTETMKGEFS